MRNILFSITLVFLLCTQSLAESSVWKIRKGGSVMFIGGTCHLLRQSDFPLPPEFEEAYRSSDILVFETDIGKFNDPSIQQKLMSGARYADGSTVEKHLSANAWNLLHKYCTANNIPCENLIQFKPALISLVLVTQELGKLGVIPEGVDTFFYKRAAKDKKDIQGLETVDQQIDFILQMGEGNEDEFLESTINDMKSLKNKYEDVVDAWRRGDIAKLHDVLLKELRVKTPKLYKEIFIDRNNNWLPAINSYHKTPRKEFILVGAGHLVGPEGIIETLRKNGYHVEKL